MFFCVQGSAAAGGRRTEAWWWGVRREPQCSECQRPCRAEASQPEGCSRGCSESAGGRRGDHPPAARGSEYNHLSLIHPNHISDVRHNSSLCGYVISIITPTICSIYLCSTKVFAERKKTCLTLKLYSAARAFWIDSVVQSVLWRLTNRNCWTKQKQKTTILVSNTIRLLLVTLLSNAEFTLKASFSPCWVLSHKRWRLRAGSWPQSSPRLPESTIIFKICG